MRFFNQTQDEFSNEIFILHGVMMYNIWVSELIAYRLSTTMDSLAQRNQICQEKKHHLNKYRRMLMDMQKSLEVVFDVNFNSIAKVDPSYYEEMEKNANDLARLQLIYLGRGDYDWEKRDRMKQALLNFKPLPDVDVEEILKYFNLK